MLTSQSHRVFIAVAAIVILLVGIFLGDYLVENLGGEALDSVKISLLLTAIALLLIIGTFVLEIKATLESKKGGKK
ncbi:MAG: hypothetical protein AABX74_01510 [Nanoarchaeota archaeon]